MKKVTILLFYLIIFLSFNTTFANEMTFGYKGRYSDTQTMIDRPATNTGLRWMKKKKKESKPIISKKNCDESSYYHGNYDMGSVSVKFHTRKLKNGKTVRVKAHRRRR